MLLAFLFKNELLAIWTDFFFRYYDIVLASLSWFKETYSEFRLFSNGCISKTGVSFKLFNSEGTAKDIS